jgi:predicted dehydrogenase
MSIRSRLLVTALCILTSLAAVGQSSAADAAADQPQKVVRVGIIGLDTSHVPAFTKILNDPKATGDLAGFRVVAGFPGGSPDVPSSRDRVEGYTKQLRDTNVEIVDSIPRLLEKVDVVLLESVDGRPHLEQVRPVFAAGKPVFIDKPLAGSLADAVAIAELGRKHNVPWFSASSLRFGPTIEKVKNDEQLGGIVGCDAWSPCPLEPHHPDFFWYGIHGVEMLFTVMGPGCESVSRTHTEGADVAVGVWRDGRIGTFRGLREGQRYGGVVFGKKKSAPAGTEEGYEPLVREIAKFFRTRKPPVAAEETLEIMAFMEAADESKRQGGKPVSIESVMEKARKEAQKKL